MSVPGRFNYSNRVTVLCVVVSQMPSKMTDEMRDVIKQQQIADLVQRTDRELVNVRTCTHWYTRLISLKYNL